MPRPSPTGSPSPTVELALAGAGTISVIHGMAAAAAGLRVTGVASRSLERAQERAEQLGARPLPYRDLPAGAEAVLVATPPSSHLRLARQALDAGCTVLVEKPLATTLADADELVAAEAGGGRVLYGENLAFAPVVGLAVAHARDLGRLGYLEVRALSPRPTWGNLGQPSWGGGVLFDLGVHPLAVALLLAGEDRPVSVSAALTAPADLEVDDQAEVLLTFASGLQARVEASWRHPDVVWDLQASSGTGVVRAGVLPTVELERDGEPVALPAPPSDVDAVVSGLGYVAQLEALARLTRDRGPSPLGATFGRVVLDVVCGAYASAGSGGPVALPFAGPRDRTPLSLWRG